MEVRVRMLNRLSLPRWRLPCRFLAACVVFLRHHMPACREVLVLSTEVGPNMNLFCPPRVDNGRIEPPRVTIGACSRRNCAALARR